MNYELKKEKDYIEVDFTHTTAETDKAFLKEYITIAKNLKINGFRPGKVPVSVAKNIVKQNEIKDKVLNEMLTEEINFLQLEEDIYDEPVIHIEEFNDSNLKSKIKLYLYPTVSINEDYIEKIKNLELKKLDQDITEEEINSFINKTLEQFIEYQEVETPEGHNLLITVDIDCEDLEANEKIISEQDYEILINEKNKDNLLEMEILKLKKHEEKEFEIKYPEDYRVENFRNKNLKYKVLIKKINEGKIPELTEEIFQQLFEEDEVNMENANEILIEKTKEKILEIRTEELDKINYEKIIDIIIENSKFELSDYILNIEKNKIFKNFLSKNELDENLLISDFAKMIEKSEEETENDFKEITRNKIYSYLILTEINKKEKIYEEEKEEDKAKNMENLFSNMNDLNQDNFMSIFENMQNFMQNDKNEFTLSKEKIKKIIDYLISR